MKIKPQLFELIKSRILVFMAKHTTTFPEVLKYTRDNKKFVNSAELSAIWLLYHNSGCYQLLKDNDLEFNDSHVETALKKIVEFLKTYKY